MDWTGFIILIVFAVTAGLIALAFVVVLAVMIIWRMRFDKLEREEDQCN